MKGVGVARTVHYVDRGGFHQAGIVRAVVNKEEGVVHLVVFGSHDTGSIYFPNDVRFCPPEKELRNSWHWPERDDDEPTPLPAVELVDPEYEALDEASKEVIDQYAALTVTTAQRAAEDTGNIIRWGGNYT